MSICAYLYCQRISGCSADTLFACEEKTNRRKLWEKYIIAVDMDGTLLNSENKISERNRNVLQRLIDDGHYVVPATGRTRELIPREFSVLRGVKWGIVENGCVVWDYDKNEMIWRKIHAQRNGKQNPEGCGKQRRKRLDRRGLCKRNCLF